MKLHTTPKVHAIFNNYPDAVKSKMLFLRELIIETAKDIGTIDALEETLKWGEPSYIAKYGSTLRINWSKKTPEQYAMYFQCTSKLVSTFRLIYNNTLVFEGNRAIKFQLNDELPIEALKNCIKATLTYHKVKHLPNLGI